MIQVEKLVAFQVARRLSPNKICIRAEASLPKAGSGASFRVASCKKPSQTISESVMGFFFRYTGSFSTNLPFQTQRIQYTIFRSKSESTQNCHTLLSVCVVFYSPPSIFGWHLMIPGVSRKFHPVLKAESCITSLFGTDTNHSSSCSHT